MSKDPGSAAFVSTPLPLSQPYKIIRDNFTFTLVHQCFPGQSKGNVTLTCGAFTVCLHVLLPDLWQPPPEPFLPSDDTVFEPHSV